MLGFSLDEGEPPADGIAQLWFDSREACQASYASEIGRRGSADASAWLGRREHLLASERWIKRSAPLSSTPFKLVFCLKRTPAQARAEFIDWLCGEGVEAIGALAEADQLRISVDEAGQLLNSGVEGDLGLISGEAPYDALVECWFADLDKAGKVRERVVG